MIEKFTADGVEYEVVQLPNDPNREIACYECDFVNLGMEEPCRTCIKAIGSECARSYMVRKVTQKERRKVLLSINPVFVEKIFNGTKKYEYRKTIFKNKDVDTVVVYATSPWQCVMGEFKIEEILSDSIDRIWEQTREFSGISENFFRRYFVHKKNAFAIKIGQVTRYEKPKRLRDYNIKIAPQSFIYL